MTNSTCDDDPRVKEGLKAVAGAVGQGSTKDHDIPTDHEHNDDEKSGGGGDSADTGSISQEHVEALAAERSRSRADLKSLFSRLYPPELIEEDGMKTSRSERLSKGYKSISLTYGEVSAIGFYDILMKIHDSYGGLPETEGVFYDLGCGTGKPVFAAAAVHPWARCIGLEILSDLHGICQKAFQRWEDGRNASAIAGKKEGTTEIEFVCGDFTVLDWSDGDVVFANSTCFGEDLMNKLAKGAAALKEGAIVVTMTDPVPSPAFEILEETVMEQAGRCATTCYIQKRVAKPLPTLAGV